MIVNLLTEHHLEFLTLKGGCRGSSETTLVKMSNCWKFHAAAQNFNKLYLVVEVCLKVLLRYKGRNHHKAMSLPVSLIRTRSDVEQILCGPYL